VIHQAVKPIRGVTAEIKVPPLGNITPTLHISWDPQTVRLTGKDLQEKMRSGEPSIEVGDIQQNHIAVTVWMLKPGQEKIVATRLREELTRATT
jgi:L-seryl-tRNA(Ser) seleniumtransferase